MPFDILIYSTSWILILIPSGVYSFIILKYLPIYIWIIFIFLLLNSLLQLFTTFIKNPGFIKLNSHSIPEITTCTNGSIHTLPQNIHTQSLNTQSLNTQSLNTQSLNKNFQIPLININPTIQQPTPTLQSSSKTLPQTLPLPHSTNENFTSANSNSIANADNADNEPLQSSQESLLNTSTLNPSNPSNSLPNQYPFLSSNSLYLNTKTIYINSIPISCKYCITCQSWRPPRTSHCNDCKRCVFKHDHHCPWTGNCIGYRNYSNFYLFLFFSTALNWFVFITTIVYLVNVINTFPEYQRLNELSSHPFSLVLIVYTFLIGWSLLFLFFYHSWLISAQLTTHEQLKSSVTNLTNPFDKGCFYNYIDILFSKLDDSKLTIEYWETLDNSCNQQQSNQTV